MSALLKNPLVLALAAAAVAWWFLRRRKAADCHCEAPPAATTGAPPVATAVYSNPPPPPPAASVTPPAVFPSPLPTPAQPSASAQCVASGGSWGWDPTRNAGFCAFADGAAPARPAVVQTPATAPTCAGIGGTTLPDGSCCVPPGCNPNPPAITPPPVSVPPPPVSVTPTPTWGGYTGDPYNHNASSGPPPLPTRDKRCLGSGGYLSTQFGYTDCLCPYGTYQNGDGFCVTSIG